MKLGELGEGPANFAAEKVVAATEELATGPVAFCICDAKGRKVVETNMGVAKTYAYLARAKALTALDHQLDTVNFRYKKEDDLWVPNPQGWSEWEIMHAAQHDPHFCGFAGGVLIINDASELVGTIGVSALAELDDHKVAERARTGWRVAWA